MSDGKTVEEIGKALAKKHRGEALITYLGHPLVDLGWKIYIEGYMTVVDLATWADVVAWAERPIKNGGGGI